MSARIVLKGGTVVRNGLIEKTDVAILGDKIERVAADIQPQTMIKFTTVRALPL